MNSKEAAVREEGKLSVGVDVLYIAKAIRIILI